MTDPSGSRGGRHSSGLPESPFTAGHEFRADFPVPRTPGFAAPRYEDARYEPPLWTTDTAGSAFDASARTSGGLRSGSGLLDRHPDETGPLVEPAWWSSPGAEHLGGPLTARHSRDEPPGRDAWGAHPRTGPASPHPSAPLPPMPPGVWDRLQSRHGAPGDDAATVAQPLVPGAPPAAEEPGAPSDEETEAHHLDPRAWEDQTGGLDVIGAHVAEDAPRPRGRRAR